MVPRFVVTSLAAINTLLSPLAKEHGDPTYQFAVNSTAEIFEQCQTNLNSVELSSWTVRIGQMQNDMFTAFFRGRICLSRGGMEKVLMPVNLPGELHDLELLQKIPPGQAFVSKAIVSMVDTNVREKIKLTRLENPGPELRYRLEWLAPGARAPSYPPLEIWLADTTESLAHIDGFPQEGLRWKEIHWQIPVRHQWLTLHAGLARVHWEKN